MEILSAKEGETLVALSPRAAGGGKLVCKSVSEGERNGDSFRKGGGISGKAFRKGVGRFGVSKGMGILLSLRGSKATETIHSFLSF